MPSKERSADVGGSKDVEAPTENAACDTVQTGQIPAYLGFVDGEMRRDGAVAALSSEDGVGVRGGDALGGCGSGKDGFVG